MTAAALVAAACGDSASTNSGAPATAPRSGPPNVLLIVMDTTRADRCSVHGHSRATTRALERLAADGVAFDTAWSSCSWTLPSHASLFTGLRPERHGAAADMRSLLRNSETTLAEVLRDAGYATGGFSNNHFVSDDFGFAQGFGTFRPLFSERGRDYPTARPTHDEVLAWTRARTAEGRPFFAFVNDMEPHAPYAPPAAFQARFVAEGTAASELRWARAFEFPENLSTILGLAPLPDTRLALLADLYDAEIATLDAEIGALLDGLRADGVLDDTLVIVTGDHGDLLGENGRVAHSLSLAAPLLHVPLVIRHPKYFTGGRRVADVVRLLDVFPTVLDVCGVPVPEGLDGASLLADVGGRVATARLGRPLGILEACARELPEIDVSVHDTVLRSAFDGRFQLIARESDDREWLYDLHADPRGETDVLASHPDVAAQLRPHLAAAMTGPSDAARVPPPPASGY